MYIDRLLDSSLPHNLIQEYTNLESGAVKIPSTIAEESSTSTTPLAVTPRASTPSDPSENGNGPLLSRSSNNYSSNGSNGGPAKLKRTPKNLYRVPETDENTPLLSNDDAIEDEEEQISNPQLKDWVPEEDEDTESPVVKFALYINIAANAVLLILKIVAAVMTSSLSVVASLVDAALDFLSTAIIWGEH
jgi:hypothetical protein